MSRFLGLISKVRCSPFQRSNTYTLFLLIAVGFVINILGKLTSKHCVGRLNAYLPGNKVSVRCCGTFLLVINVSYRLWAYSSKSCLYFFLSTATSRLSTRFAFLLQLTLLPLSTLVLENKFLSSLFHCRFLQYFFLRVLRAYHIPFNARVASIWAVSVNCWIDL